MIVKKSPIIKAFPDFDIVNLFTERSDKEYVFLDIETTGFTPANSQLYLIGCAYFSENSWKQTQWFAENFGEETAVLEGFLSFLPQDVSLVTFNGDQFDIPYLKQKLRQFSLCEEKLPKASIDLYKILKSYKKMLNFSHMRQSDWEKFVGFERHGDLPAKKCIELYQKFLREEDEKLTAPLLLHNSLDLTGLRQITSALSYTALPDGRFQICGACLDEDHLSLRLKTAAPFPAPFLWEDPLFHCTGEGRRVQVHLPLKEGKLRKFYADCENYYYLPSEDTAIHKSLGAYIDRGKRKRATDRTCYTWFCCSPEFLKKTSQLKNCLAEYFRLALKSPL